MKKILTLLIIVIVMVIALMAQNLFNKKNVLENVKPVPVGSANSE